MGNFTFASINITLHTYSSIVGLDAFTVSYPKRP